jgi:hypothetical protein
MYQKLSVSNFNYGTKGYGQYWLSFTINGKQWTIYTTNSQLIDDLFKSEKYPTQKFLNTVKKQIKNKLV